MKKTNLVITLFLMVLLVIPFMNVHAESATVKTQEELKNALQNNDINTIILGSDIETTEKINVTRNIYIEGNNHTIKYVGTFGKNNSPKNTIWGGIYVLQIYKSTATIKDIKLTGGNAGLLINGSDVTFLGTIDVSGNGFGGIELGQGSGVTETNKLNLKDNASIVNSTESEERPTLWVPNDSKPAVMDINGTVKEIASGEELAMTEVYELFGIDTTPNTNDYILNYIITTILSALLSLEAVKKVKKEFAN